MISKSKTLKWIESEIEKIENKIDECCDGEDKSFYSGYLCALEEMETTIGYGRFDENVYVKLKKDAKAKNLKNDKEYHAICVDAGRHFKVYVDDIDEIEIYSRDLFDIVKVD